MDPNTTDSPMEVGKPKAFCYTKMEDIGRGVRYQIDTDPQEYILNGYD